MCDGFYEIYEMMRRLTIKLNKLYGEKEYLESILKESDLATIDLLYTMELGHSID